MGGSAGLRTHLLHGALRGVARGEGDEGVSAVGAGHGVHHEAQVPDGAAALEQRDELVLVHVLGDLAAEHLAAGAGRAAFPPRRRTPVFALTWNRGQTNRNRFCQMSLMMEMDLDIFAKSLSLEELTHYFKENLHPKDSNLRRISRITFVQFYE